MSTGYAVGEWEHNRDEGLCKEITHILTTAYPGYTWYTNLKGGMCVIKNLKISAVWSFAVKLSTIQHDANKRKREVLLAGGAFLEAAHMRRGQWDGEYATDLEGRPKGLKFKGMLPAPQQPNSLKVVNQFGKPIAVIGENPDV